VIERPIADVLPYAGNPRKNDTAVAKVAASLREFGWRQPIVVDETLTVIAGHTRLLAARSLGMTTVPVHVAKGLTAAQVRAYRLADNRTAQEAEWDNDLLALELGALADQKFDLSLTGFDTGELARMLGEGIDPTAEWVGMPEFAHEDQRPFRSLHVHFADAVTVEDFKRRIRQEFSDKAKYIWHPKLLREDFASEGYASEP
jgi:ParB-like chromosome segregation protein Spo0J